MIMGMTHRKGHENLKKSLKNAGIKFHLYPIILCPKKIEAIFYMCMTVRLLCTTTFCDDGGLLRSCFAAAAMLLPASHFLDILHFGPPLLLIDTTPEHICAFFGLIIEIPR